MQINDVDVVIVVVQENVQDNTKKKTTTKTLTLIPELTLFIVEFVL